MKKLILSFYLLLSSAFLFAQAPGSGYALDFVGTGDYVSVPNNAALNMTAAMTLEAWIKADSWSPNSWGNVIISKDGWGAGEAGYTLRCGANGTASFMIGTTTSWKEALSTPQMVLGQWYHLAGTFDGTQVKVYINGILSGTTNYTGSILPSTYSLAIGRITYTAGGTRNFDGQIDEVRVWNSALSQATIQSNICKKVRAGHPNYANLVGYWKLDEGTGSTVADSSSFGLNGSRLGTPAWGLSGAAIGDESAAVYGSPNTVTVNNSDGSFFSAQVLGGAPTAVHVYAVNQVANSTTTNLSGGLEITHYFGTFLVGGTNPSYWATYNYAGVPGLQNSAQEQNIRLGQRSNNTAALWARLTTQFQVDTAANAVYRCGLTGRREFIAGFDGVTYGVLSTTICQGDTFMFQGQALTMAGLYTHPSTLPNGCDSTIAVLLTVNPMSFGSDSATICSGDSVLFGTQVLTTSGVYTEAFQGVNTCDSMVTFTLTVTPPSVTQISDTICDGDVVVLGTQTLTQAGIYSEVFSAVDGCDSLVTLNLSVHAVDTSVSIAGNVMTANLASPSYQWLACDQGFQAIPGATNQSFTVGNNGNYAVIVSDGICSDTSSCHYVLAIGVKNGMAELIRIYPNPAKSQLHVQRMDGQSLGKMELVGIDGRVVWAMNATQDVETMLDLEAMAAGMYFLRLTVAEELAVFKVLKQ